MQLMNSTPDRFISECISPASDSFTTAGMARGEPGLPGRFAWRGDEYQVAEVLESWKESGPMRGGGSERYLRKHWYKVRTTSGQIMKLYFERQARSAASAARRWWLYTVAET